MKKNSRKVNRKMIAVAMAYGGLDGEFSVFDSNELPTSLYDVTYDAETETWSFKIGGQQDPNGYWVEYSCPTASRPSTRENTNFPTKGRRQT